MPEPLCLHSQIFSAAAATPFPIDLLPAPGDRVLLCSDGLTNMVSDAAIRTIVLGSREPAEACSQLIARANPWIT